MSIHRANRLVVAPRELLFELVADVERYPQFLSLWKSARIYRHDGDSYFTEQEVGFGPINERFRTRTDLHPYERIDVSSIDPLFRTFRIRWYFQPHRAGTRVEIDLRWEVQSRLLQLAIDSALPMTADRMVSAFADRARTLALSKTPG
jgi:coenzyme Q-binding protein COQ10